MKKLTLASFVFLLSMTMLSCKSRKEEDSGLSGASEGEVVNFGGSFGARLPKSVLEKLIKKGRLVFGITFESMQPYETARTQICNDIKKINLPNSVYENYKGGAWIETVRCVGSMHFRKGQLPMGRAKIKKHLPFLLDYVEQPMGVRNWEEGSPINSDPGFTITFGVSKSLNPKSLPGLLDAIVGHYSDKTPNNASLKAGNPGGIIPGVEYLLDRCRGPHVVGNLAERHSDPAGFYKNLDRELDSLKELTKDVKCEGSLGSIYSDD